MNTGNTIQINEDRLRKLIKCPTTGKMFATFDVTNLAPIVVTPKFEKRMAEWRAKRGKQME